MRRVVDEGDVVPAGNQIEVHPYLCNEEVRAANAEYGIVTEAYSPLAKGRVLQDPTIGAIGSRIRRTPAQVVLRWHIQRGDVIFPKSTTPARMKENFEIFDFELETEEIAAISALDRGEAGRTGPNPDVFAYVPLNRRLSADVAHCRFDGRCRCSPTVALHLGLFVRATPEGQARPATLAPRCQSPRLDRAAEAQSRRPSMGGANAYEFEAFATCTCRAIDDPLQHLETSVAPGRHPRRGHGARHRQRPVADANGWPDGQGVPIDFALANAKRIADSTELPLTVDFESGYSR